MANSPSPKCPLLFSAVVKDKEGKHSLRSHCRARGMTQWVNDACAKPNDQFDLQYPHDEKEDSGRLSYNLYTCAMTLFTYANTHITQRISE